MCGIYCVYKQSRSCQLPFCASPIFHFEIGDFSVYLCTFILHLYNLLVECIGTDIGCYQVTQCDVGVSVFQDTSTVHVAQ